MALQPSLLLLTTLLLTLTLPAPSCGFSPGRRVVDPWTSSRGSPAVTVLGVGSEEGERRSVGDYMGGVHAGKYNFDSRLSGVTSLNYENSVMFDDLAGGGRKRILAKVEGAAPPSWAFRQVALAEVAAASEQPTITLNGGQGLERGPAAGVAVVLANDERTWEPFYTTLEEEFADGERRGLRRELLVTPTNGTLAPRGGAENACDASKPYSDRCVLTVFREEGPPPPPLGVEMEAAEVVVAETDSSKAGDSEAEPGAGSASDAGSERGALYLVVRTEMDAWSWRIEGV